MKSKKNTWIIGICCTDGEGVCLYTVYGTIHQVKKHLMNQLKECVDYDPESYDKDFSTNSINEIEEIYADEDLKEVIELNAHASFFVYHTKLSARIAEEPLVL